MGRQNVCNQGTFLMLKQHSVRIFTTMTLAAAALAGVAFAPQAEASPSILDRLATAPRAARAVPAPAPAQVLPAISNPKPYRQGVMATCNINSAQFGNNLCIMTFDKVLSGHMLQIDKISCVVNGGAAILFNSAIKLDAARLYGFAQSTVAGSTGATGEGPYYFKQLETPILLGIGSSSTDTAICSIYGTLWQTN